MKGIRALKIAVIVMSVLIVVGTVILIFLIVKRLAVSSSSIQPNKSITILQKKVDYSSKIVLPEDSKLLSTTLINQTLMLTLQLPHQQEILLFNLKQNNKLQARIILQQGK